MSGRNVIRAGKDVACQDAWEGRRVATGPRFPKFLRSRAPAPRAVRRHPWAAV